METKICGTCRFRGKEIEKTDHQDDYKEKPSGFFLCELVKHDSNDDYEQGQKAIVKDGSGYYAALCVENDFGCVLWEASNASVSGPREAD